MIDFNNTIVKLKAIANEKAAQVKDLLLNDEQVVASFESVRDKVIFTNFRIIAIDVQGISGVKVGYSMIPYKNIQAFSVETAGAMDRDCELEIFISGLGKLKFEFNSSVDIVKLSQIMSYYIL